MSAPVRGMLDLEALRREVGEGRIETIITALPDLYGRLVSPRPGGSRVERRPVPEFANAIDRWKAIRKHVSNDLWNYLIRLTIFRSAGEVTESTYSVR